MRYSLSLIISSFPPIGFPLAFLCFVAFITVYPTRSYPQANLNQNIYNLTPVLQSPYLKETIISDITKGIISITVGFSGQEVIVYGAIKRNRFLQKNEHHSDIVLTVYGPMRQVKVYEKRKKFGVWFNTTKPFVDLVPSFYALESTRPVEEIMKPLVAKKHRIGIQNTIFGETGDELFGKNKKYLSSIVRIKSKNGNYIEKNRGVRISDNTLFHSKIAIPGNIIEGSYTVNVFLIRNGEIQDHQRTYIEVQKIGVERFFYSIAKNHPYAHAALLIILAFIAGRGSFILFKVSGI